MNKKTQFIESCYKLYEHKMYHIAFKILQNESMAEDAVQDVFLKLVKYDIYFEDANSDDCKRYIIKAIQNSSYTIYNSIKKLNSILIDLDEELPALKEDELNEIEHLRESIEKLPKKLYEVVDYLVFRSFTPKEAAAELSITEANVRKRFERAKLQLKLIVNGGN